jgi:hypothetical protein
MGKSSKHQVPEKPIILEVLNCIVGHTRTGFCNGAKVWGETRLWVRYRKGSDLSELVEPEILISDDRRIHVRSRRGVCQRKCYPKPLEIARTIGSEYPRADVLKALTATLTPANVDLSFWEKTLHVLGTLTRHHFLETIPNLAPLILHFGGVVALREVHQAIREVSRWWKWLPCLVLTTISSFESKKRWWIDLLFLLKSRKTNYF